MNGAPPFGIPGIEYGLLLTGLLLTWAPAVRSMIWTYRLQCLLVFAVIQPFRSRPEPVAEPLDQALSWLLPLIILLLFFLIEKLMKYATLGVWRTTKWDEAEIARLWERQASGRRRLEYHSGMGPAYSPPEENLPPSDLGLAGHDHPAGQTSASKRRPLVRWVIALAVATAALGVSAQAHVADVQFPVALALVLLGIYNAAARPEATSRVLGILTADQGLFLLAVERGPHFELAIGIYTLFTIVVLVFLLPSVYWAEASPRPTPLPLGIGRWLHLLLAGAAVLPTAWLLHGVIGSDSLSATSQAVLGGSLLLVLYAACAGLLATFHRIRKNLRTVDLAGGGLIVLTGAVLVAACFQVRSVVVASATGPVQPEVLRLPIPWSSLAFPIRIDAVSVYFMFFTSAIGFAATVGTFHYAQSYVRSNRALIGQRNAPAIEHPLFLYAFTGLFIFTMLTAVVMDDLLTVWIWLVLTSAVSTFLVAFIRNRENIRASWNYAVFASISVGLAFVGIAVLQQVAGKTNISDLTAMTRFGTLPNNSAVVLSFFLVLAGYGVKAGLVPFHWWLPGAHSAAPSPVSALLSGLLLKTSFYAILRQMTATDVLLGDAGRHTSPALVVLGVATILFPIPFILQGGEEFKRVLAYHGMVIMGYVALAFGIGTSVAMFGASLLLMSHAVTKGLMFLTYADIRNAWIPPRQGADRMVATVPAGAGMLKPLASGFLVVGGLALVATPLAGIFLSEAYGLLSLLTDTASLGWSSGWTAVVTLAFVASSVLVFAGLVRHLTHIALGAPVAAPVEASRLAIGEDATAEHTWYHRSLASAYTPVLITLFTLIVLSGFYVIPGVGDIVNAAVAVLRVGRA